MACLLIEAVLGFNHLKWMEEIMQQDRSVYVTRLPGFTYELPTAEGCKLLREVVYPHCKPGTGYVLDSVDAVICIDLYRAGNIDGMIFFLKDMEAHYLKNF